MENRNVVAISVKLIVVFSLLSSLVIACGVSESNRNSSDSGPSFNSGALEPNDTFSYTFVEEGSVPYYCMNHAPDMTGGITVSSNAEAVERDTVLMQNLQFVPGQLTIAPNTEVIWINRENEGVEHTVTNGTPPSEDDDNGDGY